MSRRTRTTAYLLAAIAVAGSLTACGGDPLDSGSDSGSGSGSDTIVVGSANFPESELLMEMYAQALEAEGVKVETKPNIGSREVYMEAFKSGDIDLLPEYNGGLLSYLKGGELPEGVSSPDDVYDALQDVLPKGSETLPQSAAEDKDSLTVTKETAEKYSLTSVEDLAPVAKDLTLGASPEFKERPQGVPGLEKVYGVTFKGFTPTDPGGPLTIAALKKGSVDVANVFTTDSAIPTNDWVVLEDPKSLFLAQNIVPLIQSDALSDEAETALNSVSEALTTDNLTDALAKVQVDKADPATVAKEFLSDNGVN
ncbi:osmoprotectant transport system substrate-binding protein [Nocardioides albertanoniae]|uniref:Osmoprotectant transport system substrate-binding protein n=1 Tax=Nocardioides albertanoniae TaxID=1175486 RepID=A0A543A0S8_9ACTN|nr:ABC transporter substrate-binding protein [Nocardioides albertanoniae]TQL66199.1 osmoprotectant transport system substrate-binding protein [Nocardioides albertanoniae]